MAGSGAIRQEIMDWASFGMYIFGELIPGGAIAFQALLKLFPHDIQREMTSEKQAEAVAKWKAQRNADADARDLRRTPETHNIDPVEPTEP